MRPTSNLFAPLALWQGEVARDCKERLHRSSVAGRPFRNVCILSSGCRLRATLQMRMEQHSKAPIRPDFDARARAFHSGQVRMGNLDAYSRHKEYINNYVNFYGTKKPPQPQQNYKTDVDVLRENWRSRLASATRHGECVRAFVRVRMTDVDVLRENWRSRLASATRHGGCVRAFVRVRMCVRACNCVWWVIVLVQICARGRRRRRELGEAACEEVL
jgi:hypothetical protein